MKFVLCVPDIVDTRMEQHIQLACKEAAPQTYKPRKGKINGNKDKYGKKQLKYLLGSAKDLIQKLGYEKYFKEDGADVEKSNWIQEHNKEVLQQSIYNLNECRDVICLMMNTPSQLLRKGGLDAGKFHKQMRGNLDILDKNGNHLTPEELKKHMTLSGPTELDMPETADGQTGQQNDIDAVFN